MNAMRHVVVLLVAVVPLACDGGGGSEVEQDKEEVAPQLIRGGRAEKYAEGYVLDLPKYAQSSSALATCDEVLDRQGRRYDCVFQGDRKDRSFIVLRPDGASFRVVKTVLVK